MIQTNINGQIRSFSNQGELLKHLEQVRKEHEAHPYFYNVVEIQKAQNKIAYYKELPGTNATTNYFKYIKLHQKLESEREQYLKSNPHLIKPTLKVCIKQA